MLIAECEHSGGHTNVFTPMNLLLFQIVSHLMDLLHNTFTQTDSFRAAWTGMCVNKLCPVHQQFQVCIFHTADYIQIFFWYTVIFI
jgi:hypothetical protein